MKREDFVKIIKIRSAWKISKKKGNYTLPNGTKLSEYVNGLVESQMKIDSLGVMENGDLCLCSGGSWNEKELDFNDFVLTPDFKDTEICTHEEMERRVKNLVKEIVGC